MIIGDSYLLYGPLASEEKTLIFVGITTFTFFVIGKYFHHGVNICYKFLIMIQVLMQKKMLNEQSCQILKFLGKRG
ncbi:hypothetical protein CLERM_389 [Coxiella-like endosymbiont]|nr:hypothetical protein CLERM_389 [Coxiella-like endosymbiont]